MKATRERQTKVVAPKAKSALPFNVTWAPETRWALGTDPIDEGRVLKEPDAYVSELESRFNAAKIKAGDNANFYHAMRFFVQTLVADKQYDAASRIMERVTQIQSRHPDFNK
jgi:hypothetical protein